MRKLPVLLVGVVPNVHSEVITACDSQIYCHGEILDTVQKLELFEESKYFVDMGLKKSEDEILYDFNLLESSQRSNKTFMSSWVNDRFLEAGLEFYYNDFEVTENPKQLENIKDSFYRQWAFQLHKIWPELGRGVKESVRQEPDKTSFVPIQHPTVVPTGHDGRFRESYYWDSFWTFRGMLLSDMNSEVYEALVNFKDLVNEFGFIPNGTRKYYTKRSQPPFFIMMVKDYFDSIDEEIRKIETLSEFIDSMDAELTWWTLNRSVDLNGRTLFRYGSEVNTPRPEAYLQDEEVLSSVEPNQRQELAANNFGCWIWLGLFIPLDWGRLRWFWCLVQIEHPKHHTGGLERNYCIQCENTFFVLSITWRHRKS